MDQNSLKYGVMVAWKNRGSEHEGNGKQCYAEFESRRVIRLIVWSRDLVAQTFSRCEIAFVGKFQVDCKKLAEKIEGVTENLTHLVTTEECIEKKVNAERIAHRQVTSWSLASIIK